MAGVWTKRVERGRTCQLCRKPIDAGEQSLRYIRDDLNYGKYEIKSEKAICKSCAIPWAEKLLMELSMPRDDALYLRMKKNQPPIKTTW
jgi:hypothetical protein